MIVWNSSFTIGDIPMMSSSRPVRSMRVAPMIIITEREPQSRGVSLTMPSVSSGHARWPAQTTTANEKKRAAPPRRGVGFR